MSARSEADARAKDLLLMRSALCRLRLRRERATLRNALSWRRAAIAASHSPAVGRIGFGIALSLVGLGRSARLLMLAGRVLLFARAAQAAVGFIAHANERHAP